MNDNISITGNYQDVRNAYMAFRKLLREKKISPAKISPEDGEYIRSNITFNPEYTPEQAIFLFNFLQRFNNDFIINGFILAKLPVPDTIKNQPITVTGSLKYIGFNGTLFLIRFPVPFDKAMLADLKAIKGRIWDEEKRHWTLPITRSEEIKRFAEKHGFTIGDNAQRVIYGVEENLEQSYSAERIELNIPLKKELFDYQTVGVDFALRLKRTLNADEMGLGKTPQAIAYSMGLNKWPILVVCPKGLRYNLQNEFHAWTDRRAIVATPAVMKRIDRFVETGLCEVLIVNYNGLQKYFCESVEENGRGIKVTLNKKIHLFQAIIFDEAHKVRNESTQLYKIAKKVIYEVENRLLLTGTPLINKVNDFASMLELLGILEQEFGGRWKFNQKYGSLTKEIFEGGKKVTKTEDNEALLKELNIKLRSTCMIRREKHQVAKDLPDKIRIKHEVELSNRKEYDHAIINLQDYLASKGATPEAISKSLAAEMLVRFVYLKKLSAYGKIEELKEFVEELFLNNKKFVLFAWHKEILQEVKKHFPQMLIVDGDTKDDLVQPYVTRFQTDPKCNIIGLTYSKGAEGHTLTAAHNWGCLEFPWTDAILDQAESRIHRHTQTETSYCRYFVGKDTIDQYIYSIIERKRNLSKHSTGSTGKIEEVMVDELIKLLLTKPKQISENILT